jgi:hypothetical protein
MFYFVKCWGIARHVVAEAINFKFHSFYLNIYFNNIIFQHPVPLCRSVLGVSALSMCNIIRCSFIRHYFTTFFGLNGHLQVQSLLYFRTLLLTVMQFYFSCCYCLMLFLVMWVAHGCLHMWLPWVFLLGQSCAVCWSAIIVIGCGCFCEVK